MNKIRPWREACCLFWNKIRRAVFDNREADDGFTWIQRGLGLYLAGRYLLVFPSTTVMLSSQGVNVPWVLDLPEPGPGLAMAMVSAMIIFGGAMMSKGCRVWVLWAAMGVHSYLACVGLGSASGAYEYILTFSLMVMGVGATLRERAWSTRMLQFYVANIYFWAGMHKLTGGVWTEGTLLRRVMSGGWGGMEVNYTFLHALADPAFAGFVERGVVAGEIIVPLLLILPLKRKIIPVAATFVFHAGTAVFMNLAEFMCTPMLALGFLTRADKILLARGLKLFCAPDSSNGEGVNQDPKDHSQKPRPCGAGLG